MNGFRLNGISEVAVLVYKAMVSNMKKIASDSQFALKSMHYLKCLEVIVPMEFAENEFGIIESRPFIKWSE